MPDVYSKDLKRQKRAAQSETSFEIGDSMRIILRFAFLAAVAVLVAGVVASAQTPPEPGATPGVELTNISRNTAKFASVFPQVAVSRVNTNLVAVAWRQYNL